MNRIEKMIADLCPNGVEWKELGEVCITITSPLKIKKSEYNETGKVAIIDQGENFIAGYVDTENYLMGEYVLFGDHSEYIKFVDFPFVQGADGLKILKTIEKIYPKFMYYCFSNFYIRENNYKRHWSNAKQTVIPVPPLEIQEEIVKILDTMTEHVAELKSELQMRTKQYEYYREGLLTFNDHKVEWKTLGEIALVTKLAGYEFTKYINYSDEGNIIALRGLNVKNGKLLLNDLKYIDNSDFSKLTRSKLIVNDILFTYVGTVGEVAIIDKNDKYYLAPNVAMIRLKAPNVLATYIKFYMQTSVFAYKQVERLLESSSMKNLTMENIRKFRIPIPSLEIQEKIVYVLDNFDKVCNDLNIGLPKEIELRQKEYEYYREKLLTFDKEFDSTHARTHARTH